MRLMRTRVKLVLLLGAVWGGLVAGCEGRTSVLPNSDKNMRKTPRSGPPTPPSVTRSTPTCRRAARPSGGRRSGTC